MDAAIARALAKDPLDRFATTEDLARALTEEPRALTPARETRRSGTGALAPLRRLARRAAAACADCGARAIRLTWQRGGIDVLVEGPGQVADRIDAWRYVALCKLRRRGIFQRAPEQAPERRRRRASPSTPRAASRKSPLAPWSGV